MKPQDEAWLLIQLREPQAPGPFWERANRVLNAGTTPGTRNVRESEFLDWLWNKVSDRVFFLDGHLRIGLRTPTP